MISDIGSDDESIERASIQSVKNLKRRYINPLSNHLKLGIIGTVNVGKSSLFNALANKNVSTVENSLFSTLGEPSEH